MTEMNAIQNITTNINGALDVNLVTFMSSGRAGGKRKVNESIGEAP